MLYCVSLYCFSRGDYRDFTYLKLLPGESLKCRINHNALGNDAKVMSGLPVYGRVLILKDKKKSQIFLTKFGLTLWVTQRGQLYQRLH